jgi:ABC-type dipeptide/oligopeptide/nickel transport system permease subunit
VAVPVVAYLGVQLVMLVEGVVLVETIFAWPGIGHALVHAIFGRDVPMIQGTALVLGLPSSSMRWWMPPAPSSIREAEHEPPSASDVLVERGASRWTCGQSAGAAVAGGGAAGAGRAVAIDIDPARQHLARFLEAPSLAQPLGYDQLGRSMLARLAHGARLSLSLALVSVLSAAVPGFLIGLLAAWCGGWTERVLAALADAVLALPGLLLVLLLAAWRRVASGRCTSAFRWRSGWNISAWCAAASCWPARRWRPRGCWALGLLTSCAATYCRPCCRVC